MSEKIASKNIIIGPSLLLAASLAITGCSSSSEKPAKPNPTSTQESKSHHGTFNALTITYKDGQAFGSYSNPNGDQENDNFLETCQGTALIISSDFWNGNPGSVQMIPDATACKDGKITPSDFEISSTAPTAAK